jgi:thiosulfate sulfurtransferase
MQGSELYSLLSNNNDDKPVIVDIRDINSFNQGHIKDAIHLSNESLADFLRTTDPDVATVVCCYHGHSSQQAAQYLVSQDFTDVYSLDGGFSAWQLAFPDAISK